MIRHLILLSILAMTTQVVAAPLDDARSALKAKKYKRAAAILIPLANEGDATAQTFLATMYHSGDGVAIDHDKEIALLTKLAESGYPNNQEVLAYKFESGECVSQNFLKAAYWYGRAAEQGAPIAQYSLGLMYSAGRGVAEDQVEAHKWITLAAKRLTAARDMLEKRNSQLERETINAGQKRASEFIPKKERENVEQAAKKREEGPTAAP